MAAEARKQMIKGAVQLLSQRGLQATSFSEVIDLTGTPRGSIYYHFPKGKDQLVESAVESAGAQVLQYLDQKAGASALEITEYFLKMWRKALIDSKFQAGCAVLAVTVATDSSDLLATSASCFGAWRYRLAELLEQGGMEHAQAMSFSITLIAATEGAIVLARAEQNLESFDIVSEQMVQQATMLSRK